MHLILLRLGAPGKVDKGPGTLLEVEEGWNEKNLDRDGAKFGMYINKIISEGIG